ncbi:MAG: HD domain-containing protein [Promethearchaeota archaeon]
MMRDDIESRLRKIVEVSTKKEAIFEWTESATNQSVPLYNYRLDHIDEVVDLARHLAVETGADMEVVTLAAWLHDLAKPGVGGISAEQHGIVSAKMTEEILSEENIEHEKIERVTDVIKKHVGLTLEQPLEPLEAQILWEADKILKLGVIGLFQYVLNGIRLFPGRSMKQLADEIRDFLDLAGKIAGCMVTDPGKAIAQERLKTLQQVSQALDSEVNLESE